MRSYKISAKGIRRWFFSTNHKDIGILYLIFAIFSGIIGTMLSVIIRLTLTLPNNPFLGNNYQLYNSNCNRACIYNDIFHR